MFCAAEVRLHWFDFEDEIKVNANGIEVNLNTLNSLNLPLDQE
jgi:hypothetical protein